jgi:hypothetical protein
MLIKSGEDFLHCFFNCLPFGFSLKIFNNQGHKFRKVGFGYRPDFRGNIFYISTIFILSHLFGKEFQKYSEFLFLLIAEVSLLLSETVRLILFVF